MESAIGKLIFLYEFDADDALARGYLSHVLVKMDDARLYPITFYDPVRLQQDLMEMAQHGEPFIGDPGVIVIPQVSMHFIETAIERLAASGFFSHLVPTTMDEVRASKGEWPPHRRGQCAN